MQDLGALFSLSFIEVCLFSAFAAFLKIHNPQKLYSLLAPEVTGLEYD